MNITEWKNYPRTNYSNSQLCEGLDVHSGKIYHWYYGNLVCNYEPASLSEVEHAMEYGHFEIYIRNITGLGIYKKAGQGEIVQILHRATGRSIYDKDIMVGTTRVMLCYKPDYILAVYPQNGVIVSTKFNRSTKESDIITNVKSSL